MRSAFVFFLALFSMMELSYASDLSGRVVDASHDQPLIGVNVLVNNTALGTVTDINGEFTLSLPDDAQKITLSYVGYNSVELDIQQGNKDLGVIRLELGIELVTCYLTAYVPDNYSKKYGGSNSTISLETIQFQKPLGSEEILKALPGVVVSGDMGISNRLNVGIRGSYPRRADKILLMEDGTPIAPAPYLAPSAYYNPPTDRLDGIEVVKGADILQFGGNTMHGVINYVTRKPPSTPQLNMHLAGGSHGLNSQYLTYGGTWNDLSAEIQVLHKYFDGFQDNTASRIGNITTKILGKLDEHNSIYLKLNYHHETSQATYSGQTPLTFKLDPTQNPFDADDLITNRYAIDLAHTFEKNGFTLSSKLFGHQFTRDWWRQNNTLIHASDLESYLGEDIAAERYGYLEGVAFTDNDFIRVGKISNGREGVKARNRVFGVTGFQERFNWNNGSDNNFEVGVDVGLDYRMEFFGNQEITNDSSRFARSGNIVKDERYILNTTGSFVKLQLEYKGFSLEPILRYDWVKMSRQNLLGLADDVDQTGDKDYGKLFNTFHAFIPGVNVGYNLSTRHQYSFFAGVYKGFTPPTSGFGFLSVEDGEVSSPADNEEINMKPETSINFDIGFRTAIKGFSGQISYFNNHIDNFYAAGRKEAFQSLGSVNIQGIEVNIDLNLLSFSNTQDHDLVIGGSYTLLRSRITGGVLSDSDLLSAKHNDASKQELIDKINAERDGFVVYSGDEVLTGAIDVDDFGSITELELIFGEEGIANNRAPYNPSAVVAASVKYSFKDKLHVGLQLNHVGEQYTEYLNFESETNEGAIGKLESYTTLDLNASYALKLGKSEGKRQIRPSLEFYFAAKNVTGQIYRSSRLHRLSSGIMPGGFRHFQGGVKFTI